MRRVAMYLAGAALASGALLHAAPTKPPARASGALTLTLDPASQTLRTLSPAAEPAFDFVPSGRAAMHKGDGFNQIGDLHLRVRGPGGAWRDFSSARHRVPVRALPVTGTVIARADMTATMGAGFPLTVERTWLREKGAPVLRFTLANRGTAPVEVGALGMPMVFDNIITDRSLEQAHAQASFVDPYIGNDAGYLQVTRLNGKGPALLVVPDGRTPLEQYRILADAKRAPAGDIFTDRTPRQQTFEGFYDWMVASSAMADKGQPWNPATGFTLAPGERRTFGVRLIAAPTIRAIDATLQAERRPVAIGFPGYVVPTDSPADLFVRAAQPVRDIAVTPADG